MPGHSERLDSKLTLAVADRQLMESAAKNIHALLAGAPSDLYLRVVEELVDGAEWSELNDRFYQTLAFGTGGLRGRTIGKIVTRAERGDTADSAAATGRPEFPSKTTVLVIASERCKAGTTVAAICITSQPTIA